MRKALVLSIAATLALQLSLAQHVRAQSPSGSAVPVTIDNFVRAESDLYMTKAEKEAGLGKLNHRREPARFASLTTAQKFARQFGGSLVTGR